MSKRKYGLFGQSVAQACPKRMSYHTFYARLFYLGWSVRKAMREPVRKYERR